MGLDLSPVELELVDCVRAGKPLELGDAEDQQIRVETIRALMRGLHPLDMSAASDLDPRGLVLTGAVLVGRLDLDHVRSQIPLTLMNCEIRDGLTARGAHLPAVELEGSRIGGGHTTTPALDASYIRVDEFLSLDGVRAESTHRRGTVLLFEARVGGQVALVDATLTNDSGTALNAENLQVDGGVFLEGLQATGAGELGALRLLGAHVGRNLSLARGMLSNPTGPALSGDLIEVGQDLNLNGLKATGSAANGAVQLTGAHVGGMLSANDGATFSNPTGPALNADDIGVEQHLSLQGLEAIGTGKLGAVSFYGAHVGGWLSLNESTLTNPTGPALSGDLIEVGQDLNLNGLKATGSAANGAVRLTGAHVGGVLSANDGATFSNPTGPALNADDIRVEQHLSLQGLEAIGTGEWGAVCLRGANVGANLSLDKGTLSNPTGPALSGDLIEVGQDLNLNGLKATGSAANGAVRLTGAHVGGVLSANDGATFSNPTGPALNADDIRVDQHLGLQGVQAVGTGKAGAVVLVGTHVRGSLSTGDYATISNASGPALVAENLVVDQHLLLSGLTAIGSSEAATMVLATCHVGQGLEMNAANIVNTSHPISRFLLDGLTYTSFDSGVSAKKWLRLLRTATPIYTAQPYRRLAALHQAAGHDREVRATLIAQREDQLSQPETLVSERLWGELTWWTLGYGYRPWLALLWLLGTVLIAAFLTITLGTVGLAHPESATDPAEFCTRAEQILLAIDTTLPLVTTDVTTTCTTTATTAGEWLSAIGLAAQIIGWAFATLFVAGFTSAVRKT